MRIAALAAGAVGGYFGAKLAKAGHDVFFVARGAHLDAIRQNGFNTQSAINHATNRYKPWNAWNRAFKSAWNFEDANTKIDGSHPTIGT